MADVLASGTLDGAGTLVGTVTSIFGVVGTLDGGDGLSGVPVRIRAAAGILDGAGDVSGTYLHTILLGGQTRGAGDVFDGLELLGAGTMAGAGTLIGTAFRVLNAAPLPMRGSGTLGDHFPLPMIGHGDIAGYLEVTHVPCPCPPALKTFRWMQSFGPGDLELCLPYGPIVIVYSLMRMCPSGGRMVVGPPNRRPVQAGVGQFYASGSAGECGQPGQWLIQWRWQRFWYEEPQIREECFIVQDSLMAGDYQPQTCKRGWL